MYVVLVLVRKELSSHRVLNLGLARVTRYYRVVWVIQELFSKYFSYEYVNSTVNGYYLDDESILVYCMYETFRVYILAARLQ